MQRSQNTQHRAQAQWKKGQQLAQSGQWRQASAAFSQAARLAPKEAVYALNLARSLLREGQLDAATREAERAFRIDMRSSLACALWAHCLGQGRRHAEAARALQELAAEVPRDADYFETLGRALQFSGQPRPAIEAYFQALAQRMDWAEVHYQLGVCFNDIDMKEEAAQCFHTALALGLGRNEIGVRGLLCYFEREVCHWQSAEPDLAALLALLRALPDDAAVATTPFAQVTLFDNPIDQLRSARSASLHGAANVPVLPPLPPRTPAQQQGRLKLGYVSADFHQHATCILMAELLERHDRSRFQVTLYSHGRDDGTPMRRRVVAAAEHFVDCRSWSDPQIVQRIRDDGIDLLIDLKGYTKDNRLPLFAARPARVQASFLGFPGTTGARFIDYIVGDAVVTPLAHAAHFSEKIAQMPVCYQPNDRQRALPAVPPRSEQGLPEGALVLCGFNQPFKISAPVFERWCAILRRVPDAVLWLMEWNGQVRANIEREARARGVDPSRIVWAPRRHPTLHMARLQLADLFIDTWPCNAHTTASDALWAAVPVLTFEGDTFASRVASSLNHAVGLQQLVVRDAQAYEDAAVALASDRPRLRALRQQLVAQRDSCALFDSARFTADIEALFLRMVQRHDEGLAPDHLPA